MTVRKRNEFLDASESDEDENHDSINEDDAESRTAGLISHKSKRQKLTTPGSESESDIESAFDRPHTDLLTATQADHGKTQDLPVVSSDKKRTPVATTHKRTHKPGVIYLSRIPPFMRPSTVKTLLSIHGTISKMFLTPETATTYLRRKKSGGNKKHSFIDGWVEFARKKHAKQCVDAINGQLVGGKKGGWYRDDVWNARYLRGFSWEDLMQSVRIEEREREERVRVGTKKDGRERGEFLRNLERSKVEATRREKREKREKDNLVNHESGLTGEEGKEAPKTQSMPDEAAEGRRKHFERNFRQNEVVRNGKREPSQLEDVKRVLSKIF